MIRLLEDAPGWVFPVRDNVYNARIATQFAAYRGRPDGPLLYEAQGGALLSLFDGVVTLDGLRFDPEELREFLRRCGCRTLVCSGRAAGALGLDAQAGPRYTVMRFDGPPPDEPAPPGVCRAPRLEEVYSLLLAVFDNMRGTAFEPWYCDLSLKIRHGLAEVWMIAGDLGGASSGDGRAEAPGTTSAPLCGGRTPESGLDLPGNPPAVGRAEAPGTTPALLCGGRTPESGLDLPGNPPAVGRATAGIYYQNARTAVIGSVATRSDCRGRGYAGALVTGLTARVARAGKAPRIVCQNDNARRLYERLGYRAEAEYREINF